MTKILRVNFPRRISLQVNQVPKHFDFVVILKNSLNLTIKNRRKYLRLKIRVFIKNSVV